MKPTRQLIEPEGSASFLCYRRKDRRFAFNWHLHPELELTLIERGRGKRFVGDHIASYAEGDLVLLGPNLPHTWVSESRPGPGRHRAIVAQFPAGLIDPGRPECRRIGRLFERAAHGLAFPGGGGAPGRRLAELETRRGLTRYTGLLELLDALARRRNAQPLASAVYRPAWKPSDEARLSRVCAHLHENCCEPIRLADAAALAGMSPSAFSRYFKGATGRTFVAYLNELRVGRAARLLLETDLPVTEICHASGFNNLSNFNRRFLERQGRSPRAYRKAFAAHA